MQWIGYGALLVALLLLIASATAVNLNLRNLRTNRDLVERTNAILQAAAELQRDIRSAEAGQRGFLLTQDPRYLAPYEVAMLRTPVDRARLTALVRHPEQKILLAAMNAPIDAKLAELATTVRLARTDRQRALAVVLSGQGERLMEELDLRFEAFGAGERRLLQERVQAEQAAAARAAQAAAATGLLSLAAALIGLGLLLRFRNVVALREANAQLERRVAQRTETLAQANKELDAFAYTISHDLRAPLRAMHGYADAVAEDYADRLPADGVAYLRLIGQAADRMNGLIDDILVYAKLAREDLSVRPVDLDTLVGRVLSDRRIEPGAAHVGVHQPLGAVLAHPVALQQSVANLIDNALKYVAPGAVPQVSVRSEPIGSDLRLWIEDQGLGVAPEHHARVFEPFERLHGVDSYPGTGIGLAIVKRSVERMEGTSGLESSLGQGSRFWIQLPTPGEDRK